MLFCYLIMHWASLKLPSGVCFTFFYTVLSLPLPTFCNKSPIPLRNNCIYFKVRFQRCVLYQTDANRGAEVHRWKYLYKERIDRNEPWVSLRCNINCFRNLWLFFSVQRNLLISYVVYSNKYAHGEVRSPLGILHYSDKTCYCNSAVSLKESEMFSLLKHFQQAVEYSSRVIFCNYEYSKQRINITAPLWGNRMFVFPS